MALAFSGGVDSSYLLYEAQRFAQCVMPYYVKSAFQPRFEYDDACRLARELGVSLRVLSVDVLANEQIAQNLPDRCYHCKCAIFSAIEKAACADGFPTIIDGTNASDCADDRPGMRALEEHGVLSPLRLAGLQKSDIRQAARKAGLFTWDKPSYSCLATRICTGEDITAQKLEQVEQSEAFLASLGFRNFRVRQEHGTARIELASDREQWELLLRNRAAIEKELKPAYTKLVVDLEVRS